MKAVTGAQMGEIDKYSIEKLGIPGMVLMENAALQVVKHIEAYFGQNSNLPRDVLLVAGKGNNAGDAFAVARHLLVKGYNAKVYCLFDKAFLMGDARLNFDIIERLGAQIRLFDGTGEIAGFIDEIRRSRAVIDGIFGTGFRGRAKGYLADVINAINENSKYTISIDIASGIESASGKVSDSCIKADETVTFELPKIGQLVYPGASYTGKLAVESIGMPEEAIANIVVNTHLTDLQTVKDIIPVRSAEFNKGSCGKVAVVTGSHGMAGSGCLASRASLRTGSGLVYIGAPKSMLSIYQSVVPEAVGVGLTEYNGILGQKSTEGILNLIKKCDVAAIGPGLSANESIYHIIAAVADSLEVPVVLDADALNALSRDTGILAKFKKEVVITPHPGELARLTGLDTAYIQENRLEVARKYSQLWGITVVLKGAKTLIADSKGTVYINPTGNAGMATAGSGDSLTGIIASLIGQGAGAFEAAVAGVFIHGLAGDIAARQKGQHGMTAMDIVECIPAAMKKII
ncbi:bifunctional ADP-dependent NAD(P)H-hydrate dehydratase/NAD(P)H-hydrate epimerase [Ruminiclostridium cellobioparum]|uniref:bifunctional ADP-dependent NAD(P)H-hydrate dehydratase/NAD(P)H-hydrate epimerase n=1 Tax=Ruminiclostridium cellobioparum TaxID=29355 RepID=UPI0004823F09|nr:bifunctional ADP-dependent NAD(P)H-hydrate dehydratase/NAD(P)H-hydrate epimerase [Ruminiclostridium cellobioparum]